VRNSPAPADLPHTAGGSPGLKLAGMMTLLSPARPLPCHRPRGARGTVPHLGPNPLASPAWRGFIEQLGQALGAAARCAPQAAAPAATQRHAPAEPMGTPALHGNPQAPVVALCSLQVPADAVDLSRLAGEATDALRRGLTQTRVIRVLPCGDHGLPATPAPAPVRPSHRIEGLLQPHGRWLKVELQVFDEASSALLWQHQRQWAWEPTDALPVELMPELIRATTAALLGGDTLPPPESDLPDAPSHGLLWHAIRGMHSPLERELRYASACLELLSRRHPDRADPDAWRAMWHLMVLARGHCDDAEGHTHAACAASASALFKPGDLTMSLAIDGLLQAFLRGHPGRGEQRLREALDIDPGESLAWMFLSALHAHLDRGEAAVQAALQAQALTPFEPMRYYFDAFASQAMLAAGRTGEAITFGRRSLGINARHLATHRTARRGSVHAPLAGGAGLEALVHPQVLRRVARISSSIQRSCAWRRPRGPRRASRSTGRKRTRQPCRRAAFGHHRLHHHVQRCAPVRDGASSVAAGTPKKGTKAASRGPKSMSGRLKKAQPRRMARTSGLAPSCGRRCSARQSAAGHGASRVEHRVALRW
jgi:hypothetical protein